MKQNRSKDSIELKNMRDDDWDNYINHVISSDEIYVQYGYEPTRELIEQIQTRTPGVKYYSIFLKMCGEMIGYVGILPETGEVEVYIFREFRERGYGSQAVAMVIDAYFNGIITGKKETRVEAETLCGNEASSRLLEKLGFQRNAAGFRMDLDKKSGDSQLTALHLYRLEEKNLKKNTRMKESA